jgi:hypothetical protein
VDTFLGRFSMRFALTLDSQGWLRVEIGPLYVAFNVATCQVNWGFK